MYKLSEESFDLEKTYEYILSIQVSLGGFSFSVVCPTENRLLAFKTTPLKISSPSLIARRFDEWYRSESLLHHPFKKTRVIVFGDKFTLVPRHLYKNNTASEITGLLFDSNQTPELAENLVEKIDAKLLFSLPNGLNEAIRRIIGECEIVHPAKALINAFPETAKPHGLVVLFNENSLYLLLANRNKVLLANSFRINHANDVVYFVLTTLKQMGISSKSTSLIVTGKSGKHGESLSLLEKYFPGTERYTPGLATENTGLTEELISEYISLFL